jgi:hypothetical protein
MPLSKQWMWPLKAPRGELSKTSFSNCLQLHYHRSSSVARVIVCHEPLVGHWPLQDPVGGRPGFLHSLRASNVRPSGRHQIGFIGDFIG